MAPLLLVEEQMPNDRSIFFNNTLLYIATLSTCKARSSFIMIILDYKTVYTFSLRVVVVDIVICFFLFV